jgi:hypothetical protein
MSETRKTARAWRNPSFQKGVAAVEVALLAIVFFLVVFGAIEIIRVVYLNNTLYDATRRAAKAASLVNHQDSTGLDRIREHAVLRRSPGLLPFGMPVTDRHIRIDYLALTRSGAAAPALSPIPDGSLPSCLENRRICLANPNAGNCIRFVRVRVCSDDGSGACNPVPYEPLIPLIPMPINLPAATSINVVESFGSVSEGLPCT